GGGVDCVSGGRRGGVWGGRFMGVLWTIGGAFTFHIHGTAITIPGFLVVAAVIYAVAASGTMFIIGRRLITVSEKQNQAEAEYRYLLTACAKTAKVSPCSRGKMKSATASTGPSSRCCARGETFASRACGPRLSRRPAVI